jgi:hypothetical protein
LFKSETKHAGKRLVQRIVLSTRHKNVSALIKPIYDRSFSVGHLKYVQPTCAVHRESELPKELGVDIKSGNLFAADIC